MTCEDFNNIINELADYRSLAVSTRDAGVSHVALCAGCAARLANARVVSATLLLAAGAESEAAPARIKEDLLVAFAAHQQTTSVPSNVVSISRTKFRWWAAAAVAAAAVIVFAVMLSVWRAPAPSSQPQVAVKAPPIETPSVAPVVSPDVVPSSIATVKPSGKRRVLSAKNRRVVVVGTPESVTRNSSSEYIPLTYLATATAIDTGTIVRVQLSRSALVRLGLPINIESSNETVKAEVVMGDDGVARAIRLVE